MNGAIHHLDDLTMASVNKFISKFKDIMFLSVDPVKFNNSLVNKIMIFFDRGKFIRNDLEYKKLMTNYNQFIVDDFYRMSFQNVFHYLNIDVINSYSNWKKSPN